MDKAIDDENIDLYLNGRLSGEVLRVFEGRLAQDKDLAHALWLRQGIQTAIKDRGVQELEATLSTIRQEWNGAKGQTEKQKATKSYSFRQYMAIAASLVILAVAGIWLLNANQNTTPGALFEQYYQAPFADRERALENQFESLTDEALASFAKEGYKEALNLFDQAAILNPNSLKVAYYRGHCYLNTEKPAEAIVTFEQIVAHGDNIFVVDAEWYLALAYIKTNQIQQAKALLEGIEGETHKASAAKLLSDLPE